MGTQERKERERARRQREILDVGERLLAERGYTGLRMDDVALEVEFSKGTVYLHFASKEDLVGELLVGSRARRLELLERAARWRGPSRERIAALFCAEELLAGLEPAHGRLEAIIREPSIVERISDVRRRHLAEAAAAALEIYRGVVRGAAASRDLERIPDPVREQLALSLFWLGGELAASGDGRAPATGPGRPARETILHTARHLADGHGWDPSSEDLDEVGVRRRVLRDVFAAEAHGAAATGGPALS